MCKICVHIKYIYIKNKMDIIKNCFKKCVYAFNSDKFVNSEEECVKECIE